MAGVASPAATTTTMRSIVGILKSPCQVATNLNWRKFRANLLSVRMSRDSIELAVASHPECRQPIHTLPSIPLLWRSGRNGGGIDDGGGPRLLCGSVADELRMVLDEWRICGMVVSWPVREGTGRCGAACGRVLRALDQLHSNDDDDGGRRLFHPGRPVCLWDERHRHPDEDAFGRSPDLGRAAAPVVHVASREQYDDDRIGTSTVADVWDDYRRVHWPELEEEEGEGDGRRLASPDDGYGFGGIDGWAAMAHHHRGGEDDDDGGYAYRNALL